MPAASLVFTSFFHCDGSEHSLKECSSTNTWQWETLHSNRDTRTLSALSCEGMHIIKYTLKCVQYMPKTVHKNNLL
jgi:hypothetical protein